MGAAFGAADIGQRQSDKVMIGPMSPAFSAALSAPRRPLREAMPITPPPGTIVLCRYGLSGVTAHV